jgi:WD repeat-containing protein 48
MAKKARQRISYGEMTYPSLGTSKQAANAVVVLENAKSSEGGHRLGVNGLAVDNDNAIL